MGPWRALCRRQVSRDKATNVGRAMSYVSSAIIFGGIFWRMGASQSSIQDRMGLLQARHMAIPESALSLFCLAVDITCEYVM